MTIPIMISVAPASSHPISPNSGMMASACLRIELMPVVSGTHIWLAPWLKGTSGCVDRGSH